MSSIFPARANFEYVEKISTHPYAVHNSLRAAFNEEDETQTHSENKAVLLSADKATIQAETVRAKPNSYVNMKITVTDNPGILGAVIEIAYPDELTLIDAQNGEAFAALDMTRSGALDSPCKFMWDKQDILDSDIQDGVILILTFYVSATAISGEKLPIAISAKAGAAVGKNLDAIPLETGDGSIIVDETSQNHTAISSFTGWIVEHDITVSINSVEALEDSFLFLVGYTELGKMSYFHRQEINRGVNKFQHTFKNVDNTLRYKAILTDINMSLYCPAAIIQKAYDNADLSEFNPDEKLSDLKNAALNSADKINLIIESVNAAPNSVISVPVSIHNNPGILGAALTISYDHGLTLISAKSGEAFQTLRFSPPGQLTSPCLFQWENVSISDSDVKDGVILTLTFQVSPTVEIPSEMIIQASYMPGEIVDLNLNPINDIDIAHGHISVLEDIFYGDVNDDDSINITDVILMRRYIVGGYQVQVNTASADLNLDGVIDVKDVILLLRYRAGGYGITLPYRIQAHTHILEIIPAKAATADQDGNIAYWRCTVCGKYFIDGHAAKEISLEDTVIPATGLQEIKGKSHSIRYDIANGDPYLEALLEENEITNKNQSVFGEESGLYLYNISVAGYQFLGWYDGAGDNAIRIQQIEKGVIHDVELYAHWRKIEYKVQYRSDLFVEKSEELYTVDTGLVLPTPKLSNYIFTGWSDEDGNLYPNVKIPEGTTGNLTLTANWTSERNKTYTKTKLDAPVIYEDEENHVILFAYEIGEVRNVPLYTIHDFGYISGDGVTKEETKSYKMTTSSSMMESYAKSIANATTASSSWTLSDEWNECTDVNESWCQENGYTKEQAQTVATSNTNTWNISSGSSGSTDTTLADNRQDDYRSEAKIGRTTTDSSKVSSYNKHSSSETASLTTGVDIGISSTASVENTSTIGAKIPAGPGEISGSNSTKVGLSTTVSENLSVTGSLSTTTGEESGSEFAREHQEAVESEASNSQGVTTMRTNSSTSASSWNNSASYGGSSSNSQSESVSQALTEKISQATSYGKTYAQGGGKSETEGHSSTVSTSDEYGGSVAYSKMTEEEVTRTWTTSKTKSGYHRWIVAGTAHVFGVVGYDMANDSYFVYTHSVMDDETHEFEDYSYTDDKYQDNENGVIPFEIPYDVCEYVANRVNRSGGLKIDKNTGVITEYNRDYKYVVIPEYWNTGDGNVVKVTGISEKAFKGNTNIKAVILSDYITELPANAFAGCSSLVGVAGTGVTKIGARAFDGCTSFVEAVVPEGVTLLGDNAFQSVHKVTIHPNNADVAEGAANCGAEHIILSLESLSQTEDFSGRTLNIPGTAKSFEFDGFSKTFNNMTINSQSASTTIKNTGLVSHTGIPLLISSPEIHFNQISVEANGIALVLSADRASVSLQGDILIRTEHENAMLCKETAFYESSPSIVGKLNILGKLLTCGTITGDDYLTYDSRSKIDEETFERMLHSYTLNFDANGGICEIESREIANSTPIGPLPTPTKQHYKFAGWFLSDGTRVTDETVFSTGLDQTVIAHWTNVGYVIDWSSDAHSNVIVDRVSSLNADASLGRLSKGEAIYAGDVLHIIYNVDIGYKIVQNGTDSITVNGNVSANDIYVSSVANTYDIIFNANGGNVGVNRKTVTYDDQYGELPSPTRNGYIFNGWFTEASGGSQIVASSTVRITNSITLYAHWDIIQVTVPNFNGWSVTNAENWCRENGLNSSVSYYYYWQLGEGTVIDNTNVSESVNYGSTVIIRVSRGAKPLAEGDIVYYEGGTCWSNSYGGNSGYIRAGEYQLNYLVYGRPYSYHIGGKGWVQGPVYQRSGNEI